MFNRRHRTKPKADLTIERLDDRVVPAVHHFHAHALAAFPGPFPFSGGFVNGQFLPASNNGVLLRGASRLPGATFGRFTPTSFTPFPNPGGNFGVFTTPNSAIAFQGANMFASRPFSSFNTFNPFLTTPTPISPVFPNSGGSFGGFSTPFSAISFQGSPFNSRPFASFNGSPGGTVNPTPFSPVFPRPGGNFGVFGPVAFQ